MITLAVSKGRIYNEAEPLLQKIGCAPDTTALRSRSLIIPTANVDVRLIVVRGQDAPTYVACGAADAGIVGSDVLAEATPETLYQPLDLRIACCRVVAAAMDASVLDARGLENKKITVATKYINLARDYFTRCGISANYIKLYGTMELAPLLGVADVIVDVADTGDTLRAHNLKEIALIREVSSVFIVNRVAARKNTALANFEQRLARAIDD